MSRFAPRPFHGPCVRCRASLYQASRSSRCRSRGNDAATLAISGQPFRLNPIPETSLDGSKYVGNQIYKFRRLKIKQIFENRLRFSKTISSELNQGASWLQGKKRLRMREKFLAILSLPSEKKKWLQVIWHNEKKGKSELDAV